MTIQDEHASITLKSLIDISLMGLKLLALFNGARRSRCSRTWVTSPARAWHYRTCVGR
jgi:hypothetical protein